MGQVARHGVTLGATGQILVLARGHSIESLAQVSVQQGFDADAHACSNRPLGNASVHRASVHASSDCNAGSHRPLCHACSYRSPRHPCLALSAAAQEKFVSHAACSRRDCGVPSLRRARAGPRARDAREQQAVGVAACLPSARRGHPSAERAQAEERWQLHGRSATGVWLLPLDVRLALRQAAGRHYRAAARSAVHPDYWAATSHYWAAARCISSSDSSFC